MRRPQFIAGYRVCPDPQEHHPLGPLRVFRTLLWLNLGFIAGAYVQKYWHLLDWALRAQGATP